MHVESQQVSVKVSVNSGFAAAARQLTVLNSSPKIRKHQQKNE